MIVLEPNNRLKIGQILNHPWFDDLPPLESLEIFNETEITNMKSKFIFVDSDEKLDENGNQMKMQSAEEAQFDDKLDAADFEGMSLESTQQPKLRNLSSKSDVLAPFNTTISKGGTNKTTFLE